MTLSEVELVENTDYTHPKFLKRFSEPMEVLPLQKPQDHAYE